MYNPNVRTLRIISANGMEVLGSVTLDNKVPKSGWQFSQEIRINSDGSEEIVGFILVPDPAVEVWDAATVETKEINNGS